MSLASEMSNQSMKALSYFKLPLLLTMLLFLGGCATTSTLSQPVHENKPLVMSGVRLNLASLRNDAAVSEISVSYSRLSSYSDPNSSYME